MKKIAAAVIILGLTLAVTAVGKTGVGGTSVGQWSAGANLGYSIGLSGFDSYSNQLYSVSYKPTFAFDIFGQYQWKKQFAIGAEIYWQGTKWSTNLGYYGSSGQSFTNILALGTYEFSPGKQASLILLGGAGIYESDFGLNGGIGYRKFMSPELALKGGARAHVVLSNPTFAWLQLFFGAQYFFGK
jgi:hypothetical protein